MAQGGKTGVEGPGLSVAQRLAYGIVLVGGRYVWARLSLLAAAQHWADAEAHSWRATAWSVMRRGETAFRLASLANLLAFLHYGAYRYAHVPTLHPAFWFRRSGLSIAQVRALCVCARSW